MLESRIIKISSKNQITLPKHFVEKLNMSEEVQCLFTGKEIVIRPLHGKSKITAAESISQGQGKENRVKPLSLIRNNGRNGRQGKDNIVSVRRSLRRRSALFDDIFGDED